MLSRNTRKTSGMNDRVAVLLSGGLDSAVMLAHLVKHYQHVQPVYVRCGLFWEEMELEFLRKFLAAFNNAAIQEVQELSFQLDETLPLIVEKMYLE